jgi:hypothetical protein
VETPVFVVELASLQAEVESAKEFIERVSFGLAGLDQQLAQPRSGIGVQDAGQQRRVGGVRFDPRHRVPEPVARVHPRETGSIVVDPPSHPNTLTGVDHREIVMFGGPIDTAKQRCSVRESRTASEMADL